MWFAVASASSCDSTVPEPPSLTVSVDGNFEMHPLALVSQQRDTAVQMTLDAVFVRLVVPPVDRGDWLIREVQPPEEGCLVKELRYDSLDAGPHRLSVRAYWVWYDERGVRWTRKGSCWPGANDWSHHDLTVAGAETSPSRLSTARCIRYTAPLATKEATGRNSTLGRHGGGR